MKYGIATILMGMLLVGVLAEAKPNNTTQALMKVKLNTTQNLLEALMREDLKAISQATTQLHEVSRATEWHKGQDAEFLRYSRNFQDATDFLKEHADGKNLEGVAMGYVRLTLTCMQCHNFVREGRTR